MSRFLSTLCLTLLVLAFSGCNRADSGSRPLRNADKNGLAIEGYDPVAYFPEGGGLPRKGRLTIIDQHVGLTYRFATEANRARFQENAERYAPAFGGWCAWAMVQGDRVDVDPRSFLVEDGRLLLFYDGFFADTRASWREASSPALGQDADSHWAVIVREASAR